MTDLLARLQDAIDLKTDPRTLENLCAEALAALRQSSERDAPRSQAGQEDVRQEELAQLRYETGMYQALYENLKAQSPPKNSDMAEWRQILQRVHNFMVKDIESGDDCLWTDEYGDLYRDVSDFLAFPRDAQQGAAE